MNKNEKLILDIIKLIWIGILFILKWIFKIFTFLWVIIWEIENLYIRILLWILLTSIFIFWAFILYENRETLANDWIKWVMCIRFPKSCIKHEVKEEYYSWTWVLNSK